MASIFTRIVRGEIPCYKVAETDTCLAFLDIHPNRKGHTLCIPKREVDQWTDLEAEEYQQLMLFSHRVAQAIKRVIPCRRVGLSIVGLDVAHTHIHLIPIENTSDMTFLHKEEVDADQMKVLADQLQKSYQELYNSQVRKSNNL